MNFWFQSGKHDAIVKNVHDLLAKLAWDFTPDQLDHLFECFQVSGSLQQVMWKEKNEVFRLEVARKTELF